MFTNILRTLIAGKDIDSMTTSQARTIVDKFLDIVTIKTMSWTNDQHLDYYVKEALEQYDLDCFYKA